MNMIEFEFPELVTPLQIRSIVEKSLEPVVFSGSVCHWDILSWSLETWAEILGEQELPFRSNFREINQHPQWESQCHTVRLTMKNFIKDCKLDPTKWLYFDYKHMEEWFSDNAKILESVTWDRLGFPERKGKDSTLWIGSQGAHTPCHLDTYGFNLVAQVYGRKQWILFPPEATASMLPTRVPYEESSVYSSRNFNYPDSNMAQDLQGAQPRVITLNPGDVLFVPRHWWHYVENLDTAISVNTWIPLEEDNSERVKEALVALLISQICKDLPNSSSFLNPNEVDLIDHPLSTLMTQIETSLKTSVTSPEERLTVEPAAKKLKLSSQEQTPPEVEIDYKNINSSNAKTVPKCLFAEFEVLLESKRNSVEAASPNQSRDQSKSSSLSSKDALIQRVINSFCNPDIISLVKKELMNKAMHPCAPTSSD